MQDNPHPALKAIIESGVHWPHKELSGGKPAKLHALRTSPGKWFKGGPRSHSNPHAAYLKRKRPV